MRIGIDAHMVGSRETGNETYCVGLLEGLASLSDEHNYVAYLSGAQTMPAIEASGRIERRVLASESSVWRLLRGFAKAFRADRLDLLHVTYNVPLFARCPRVVSVHDISFVHYPEFFSKRDLRLLSAYVPYSLKVARRVLTLSESAARDLEQVYRVPRGKISVIPLAARSCFQRPGSVDRVVAIRDKYRLAGPYFLAVGNLQPRKNLARLVEAFSMVRRHEPDLRLGIAGKAQWRESEVFARVSEYGLEDAVVFAGYVPDEELASLYQGSLGVVYPSVYEGFGLPILEAMASGTPVICSNTSSMPEVAGDAALLVDPTDTAAIADAMLQIAQNQDLRAQLIEVGKSRVAKFSWVETARQTVLAYEQCMQADPAYTARRIVRPVQPRRQVP